MRRAFVTGAYRGIGLATAKRLKDAGLDVLVGVRNLDAGRAAAAEIGATALPWTLLTRKASCPLRKKPVTSTYRSTMLVL